MASEQGRHFTDEEIREMVGDTEKIAGEMLQHAEDRKMINGLLPELREEYPGKNSYAAVFKGELIGVFDGLDGAVEGLKDRDIDPQNTAVVQINPPKRHQILIEG